MNKSVKTAFELKGIKLAIEKILPIKKVAPALRVSIKYKTIAASVKEVGIIEPLIVYPQNKKKGLYTLLDGHLRLDVLKEMKVKKVDCLIATDDETVTYNHKVNRLSTIQEHFMIMKALENGVAEDKIAKTLNVDVAKIKQNRNLLHGICPEAVEMLKEKPIFSKALRLFKKVTAIRQIEMAELMVAADIYTYPYASALFAATPPKQLLDKEKELKGVSADDVARMEREMEQLEKDYKLYEDSYGQNVLNLVLARGYLLKLLGNSKVVRFLTKNNPEILNEFQNIAEAISLET